MPLSFYPGKTDEQLLRGFSFMDPMQVLPNLDLQQHAEFDVWINSDEVKRITCQNTRQRTWGVSFALWMKLNLLVGFLVVMIFHPVPLNGTAPTHFIGWWLLIAGGIGAIAPIKVGLWWFWLIYVTLMGLMLGMAGLL